MYPDWPKSAADLVPLPRCDGPKLKPFEFHGPQTIEFLEYIGEGAHGHVFKIKIHEEVYALKLFRFLDDDEWSSTSIHDDVHVISAFANYAEPFNCECRAYGRLQETGNEKLTVQCFGYLLLDERHERIMMDQFQNLRLERNFCGSIHSPQGFDPLRSRFLGRNAPIRGLVKEFGQPDQDLTTPGAKKILQNIISLQQLGIFNLDVAHRQIINGRISDFSSAVTIPHFKTSPELNPNLSPDQISGMEFETFYLCFQDYRYFDNMIKEFNEEERQKKKKIHVSAFPSRPTRRYRLRGTQSRIDSGRQQPVMVSKDVARFYTHVDPRKLEVLSKKQKPTRWNHDIHHDNRGRARMLLNTYHVVEFWTHWEYKDGHMFLEDPKY
ncbi:hypothetical protein M426DRAFT_262659 [Hypoxylon sp. CI-4A]|nr:hypothetical protein M426DRAFT_262659 [Hypoxylon sp. CI-4A]